MSYGDGVTKDDTYFSGVVKNQYFFVWNGTAYGVSFTDNTDEEKRLLIQRYGREFAEIIAKSRNNGIANKLFNINPDNPENVDMLGEGILDSQAKKLFYNILKGYWR